MSTQKKSRRPKPINFGKKRTLRLGAAEEDAIEQMRVALAKSRGVKVGDVDFSEATRILLVENLKSAMVLAGKAEAWPTSSTVDLPQALWDLLTDCRNRLSHSQGSLYTIMRKLNFDEDVTPTEVDEALEAVRESKAAVARIEDRLVEFVTEASAGVDDGSEAA